MPTLEEQLLAAQNKSAVVQDDGTKLRTIFQIIDVNRDGMIEAHELENGLRTMGIKMSVERVRQMFGLADQNHDGEISFEEFAKFFKMLPKMVESNNILSRDIPQQRVSTTPKALTRPARRQSKGSLFANQGSFADAAARPQADQQQQLVQLFNSMDTNNSGTIEIDELRDGFKQVGYDCSEGRMAQLFAAADADHDERIDFNEFSMFFENLPDIAQKIARERERTRAPPGVVPS